MSAPEPPPSPGPAPSGTPRSAVNDDLFGKTIVREGLLSPSQLEEALRAQKAMGEQGVRLRLGEVLVRQGLLTAEQVREFLALAGKQILQCPRCLKNYNIKNWSPGREVYCPTCSVSLVVPTSPRTLDAHGTQTLATLPRPAGAADPHDSAGQPFGRYRLLEKLGQGGMGVVWKAWDTDLKRVIALKQIRGDTGEEIDAQQIERFMREARAAARLRHAGIVSVHDVGLFDGQHYFTSDYIPGRPLSAVMKKPLPLRTALALVRDVAEALQYAHDEGIVHRDVKPGNILVDGRGRPHVMDFGLAKDVAHAADSDLTVEGSVLGTPLYMSPEQAAGRTTEIGPASDQFSLGAVLYELLTQRPPFRAAGLHELLSSIIEQEPVRPRLIDPKVPEEVETICLRAMEKDVSRRYPSIGEFAADLGRHLEGEPIHARPISVTKRILRKANKHRAIVIPTAAAVLLGLGIGTWAVARSISQSRAITDALDRAARAEARSHDRQTEAGHETLLKEARDAFLEVLHTDAANATAQEGQRRVETELAVLAAERAKAEKAAAERTVAAERSKAKTESEKAAEEVLLKAEGLWREARQILYQTAKPVEQYRTRLDAAMKLYDEAIAKAPDYGWIYESRGRVRLQRNDLNGAEADLLKAIQLLGPERGKAARRSLGRVYLERAIYLHDDYVFGSADEEVDAVTRDAASWTARALEQFQASAGPIEWRGTEDEEKNGRRLAEGFRAWAATEDETAVRILKEGAEKDADEECAWALSIVVTDIDEQERWLERALQLRPRFARALIDRAVLKGDQEEDYDGAIADLNEALSIDPDYATAIALRAAVRVELGNMADAIADYDTAVRLEPDNIYFLLNRADARSENDDKKGALADYDEAIRRRPEIMEARYSRALVRLDVGDQTGALADLDACIESEEEDAVSHTTRGEIRFDRGDMDAALADFEEAIRIDPKEADAWLGRGRVRLARGEAKAAAADLEKALSLGAKDWASRHEAEEALKEAKGKVGEVGK